MFLHEQDAQPDLHDDYDELQIKPIQQQQTAQVAHRSNAKTSYEPGAGNRQPAAASFNQIPSTIHHQIKIPELPFSSDLIKNNNSKKLYIITPYSFFIHSKKALSRK